MAAWQAAQSLTDARPVRHDLLFNPLRSTPGHTPPQRLRPSGKFSQKHRTQLKVGPAGHLAQSLGLTDVCLSDTRDAHTPNPTFLVAVDLAAQPEQLRQLIAINIS